jgi:hypothetical protein
MAMWVWTGVNPVGSDWSLGSVEVNTLQDALRRYKRRLQQVTGSTI